MAYIIKEKVVNNTPQEGEGIGDHFIKMCMNFPTDCPVCGVKGLKWCECKFNKNTDHDCHASEEDGCEVCNFSGATFDSQPEEKYECETCQDTGEIEEYDDGENCEMEVSGYKKCPDCNDE